MRYEIGDLFGISGKVAVITGAAGGIGSEIAIGLAQVGARVVLVDMNREPLDSLETKLCESGFEAMSVKTDVTSKKSVENMTSEVIGRYEKIDILVNCAGIAIIEDSAEFDVDKWELVMDVNVKGTMLTCQTVGKHMLQNHNGRIINFSSVRGLQGKAGYLAYAPSKGAVNLLTKTLAVEWARAGINVNAIAPIFTLTEMNKKLLDDKGMYEWVLGRLPKGRLCEKSELVGPVIFLCSKASEFMTGEIMYVDGGWTAG